MLDILIILMLGIMPPVLSLWMLHRSQSYQRLINTAIALPIAPKLKALPPADMVCIEGFGYVIGKVSCKYNARSPHIRCAVNPDGPCQDCRYYESL